MNKLSWLRRNLGVRLSNLAEHPAWHVCSAVCSVDPKQGRLPSAGLMIGAAKEIPLRHFARNISSRNRGTGFLDRRRQFCSDRHNEIFAPPAMPVPGTSDQTEKQEQQQQFWLTTIGSPGRERHVTEEAFSTTIRSRYRAVIRSADHGTVYSRCLCGRQAHDGLLGSLGTRRQQGLHGSRQ